MYNNKHILVTGGAGYIGSVLTGTLLDAGYRVKIYDRLMFGGEGILSYIFNDRFSIDCGDIRDTAAIKKALKGIDIVIHLAALVGEPACRKNPKVTRSINLDSTIKLAQLAKNTGVSKFILSSTCSNYGITEPGMYADESTKLNPLSLYAETKIAAERAILSLKSNSFHPTVLRLATIFGLSPKMRFNLMVNEFAKETALNGKISIVNKDSWRPFLHIKDAAEAFKTAASAEINKIDGEIFNVVGENIQKKYLADLAKKINYKITVSMEQGKLDDLRSYKVSSAKFTNSFSFVPKYTVEDGFKEIMNAVKKGFFIDTNDFRFNGWYDEKIFSVSF